MGYRVHNHNDKYKIIEVSNGEVRDVMLDLSENAAKEMSKNLNKGFAFDGFTPDFFLNRLTVSV